MTDRFEEIREEWRAYGTRFDDDDIVWLIGEVERLRAEVSRLRWFEENMSHLEYDPRGYGQHPQRCMFCRAPWPGERHEDCCEYVAHGGTK